MSYEEIPPDVVSPHDATQTIQQTLKCKDTVIALYDFPGTQPSHLPLDLGDTVYVLAKSDSGWWDGVVISNGEMLRGWFPHNYVRSVNYVQPVLNKLKSNKEIDTITAANTAANVLIPSFANLLQRSLVDLGKNSPASNTRKNSVVSFASLETSISDLKLRSNQALMPSLAHTSSPSSEVTEGATPPTPNTAHQPSFASTISSPSEDMPPTQDSPPVKFIPVEEAERLCLELKQTEGKNIVWTARGTTAGDIVFYSEQLEVYCETLPLVPLIQLVDLNGGNLALPTVEAVNDISVVNAVHDLNESNERSNSSVKGFDLKRDSNASSMSTSSSVSSYHHFLQPFFAASGLFYNLFDDITKWTELKDHFNYLLDLTHKALKDSNKQLFSMHLSQLTKVVSIVLAAARLCQHDFSDSKYEASIRRKLKRITNGFSQLYINGLLHLSVMHYSVAASNAELFSLDIRTLNKSTGPTQQASVVSPTDSISSQSGSAENRGSVADEAATRVNRSVGLDHSQDSLESYLLQADHEVDAVRSNMNGLIKLFIRLSKGKKITIKDYDSSDASEDEGEDRYNVLPQVYPRFLADEFNGGNWCNPFFTNTRPYLNLSGDHLKNRYHLKVIIDSAGYDRVKQFTSEIVKISKETLGFLDPKNQGKYYNEQLRNGRNEQILRFMYKYLHHASSMIDLLESFDFTVFCLIKRSSSGDSLGSNDEVRGSQDDENTTGNLTFDYTVVLEFFQAKQYFHTLVSKVIMYSQTLTLEDPDVFTAMKEDDPVLYNRETIKDPLERSALVLSNILMQQSRMKPAGAITLDKDEVVSELLSEGIDFCDHILTLVQQLVEERETILNYATRVMHDDFNVQLLVIERNNTAAGDKNDDSGAQYYSSREKNDDTPWYLEGDEECDLLLDIKGNIKGGTKEALVAHLTRHESLDAGFISVFLTTFATMMSIGEFIQLLINRFNMEAPEGLSYEEYLSWKSNKQQKVRAKVLDVMKLLIDAHWCDSYYSVTVLQRWMAFVQLPSVKRYPTSEHVAAGIEKILKGEHVPRKPETAVVIGKPPAPILKGFSLKKIKLQDIDYIEFARQITIREFHLFCQINKLACVNKVWGKKSGLNESIEPITNFIKASNQLTNFVAYMILRKDDAKKRVRAIRYFVQVAEKCRQYNNFSSMTAIISALYSSPIHRLKKTWAYVSRDILTQLQNMNRLMNSTRNFNEYRDVLKFIGSEPCVPFFGVYLSDLTFIYHGNPQHLLNRTRMINFAKRAKTVQIVEGIDRFQKIGYNFQSVNEIQKYLDLWFDKCPSIEEQYQLSLSLEPRESVDRSSQKKSSRSEKDETSAHHSTRMAPNMSIWGLKQ